MQLSKERLGRFTASEAWKLWPGVRGGKGTRNTYIQEKAEEIVTGQKKEFSNKATDHGHQYEAEAIEVFGKMSGLIVEGLEQQFFPIGDNAGATPDAGVVDFSATVEATVDVKCPTTTFFDQKLEFISENKNDYQNCPKEYFIQAQVQMLAVSLANKKLGLPPVERHYLVRYLAPVQTDYYGNEISYEHLPLEARIFWAEIKADKKWQDEFLEHVDTASKERDLLVKIMRQPIIPVQEKEETIVLLDSDDNYPQKYAEKISKGKELRKKLKV